MKEAYDIHFAATIERAEKQIILAKYGRRLLNYLDDTPVVPGDVRQPFAHAEDARQLLSDAEQDLQSWQPNLEPINTSMALGNNLMPSENTNTATATSDVAASEADVTEVHTTLHRGVTATPVTESQQTTEPREGTHLAAATTA